MAYILKCPKFLFLHLYFFQVIILSFNLINNLSEAIFFICVVHSLRCILGNPEHHISKFFTLRAQPGWTLRYSLMITLIIKYFPKQWPWKKLLFESLKNTRKSWKSPWKVLELSFCTGHPAYAKSSHFIHCQRRVL